MKPIKKYVSILLILSIVMSVSTVYISTTSAAYNTIVPDIADTAADSCSTIPDNMTKVQLSLETFIKENNLTNLAIPETLPEKTLEALEKLCDERPYQISFYYYDITTGFTMSYNEDRVFRAASCIKMPYMCYILHLVDEGEISLDDELTLQASDIQQGTSEIRDKGFKAGTKFTIKQLIEYLMIYSDNTAFRMLSKFRSVWKFAGWANNTYGTKFNTGESNGENSMTSKSTARMLRVIYEKANNGEENYIWLIELLKKANKNTFVKFGIANDSKGIWYKDYRLDVEVAHKYGMDIHASNDAALVLYENRPYILVILTDWIGYPSDNAWYTEGDMRTVSYYIFQLHKYIMASGKKEQ